MGAQQALFSAGGALGPAVAGVLQATAHGYTPVILLTTAGFLIAAITIAAGTWPRVTAPVEVADTARAIACLVAARYIQTAVKGVTRCWPALSSCAFCLSPAADAALRLAQPTSVPQPVRS